MADNNGGRIPRCLFALIAFCVGAAWSSGAAAEGRAVVVQEAAVRSAPFDVAPVIGRLHAGDRIYADDQTVQGAWRRVALPDGRWGFVRDADTEHTDNAPAPPSGASPAPAAAPPIADAAPPSPAAPISASAGGGQAAPASAVQVVTERPSAATEPDAGPHLVGVMFELLPVGTLSATAANKPDISADSIFAVAVAPFIDGAVSPYVALGLSPQMIFRVKADGATGESSKELDIRARVTGRIPLSPRARVFGRVSPAYSLILIPPAPPAAGSTERVDRPTPKGFLIDATVGVEVAVLPKLFVISDVGYQAGFQSTADGDLHSSYLHLGAGFAVGF
jgi:hypothetical protein